jgi:hypothetical protein
MPKHSSTDPVSQYLSEIQRNLSSGIAREQTHRRALEDLLESLDPTIDALNDPKHIDVRAPDFTIRRKGHGSKPKMLATTSTRPKNPSNSSVISACTM